MINFVSSPSNCASVGGDFLGTQVLSSLGLCGSFTTDPRTLPRSRLLSVMVRTLCVGVGSRGRRGSCPSPQIFVSTESLESRSGVK